MLGCGGRSRTPLTDSIPTSQVGSKEWFAKSIPGARIFCSRKLNARLCAAATAGKSSSAGHGQASRSCIS